MLVKARNGGIGGYGIRINQSDRDTYFDRNWQSVFVHIDNKKYEINITSSFWYDNRPSGNKACIELRGIIFREYFKKFGWVKENNDKNWTRYDIPSFQLKLIKDNTFELINSENQGFNFLEEI